MSSKAANEEFDRAYENVGLLASDVWSYKNDDLDYKKANLNLWIRFNDTEKRLFDDDCTDIPSSYIEDTGSRYNVQDILPFSRLATYGKFEYDERREQIYVSDDGVPLPRCTPNSNHLSDEEVEVWMLPEVEKEFKRYSKSSHSGWCTLSPRYPSGRELVSLRQITNSNPHQWLSESQWQNRLLSHYAEKLPYLKLSTETSMFRDDLDPPVYDDEEVETKLLDYPFPRYLIDSKAEQKLHRIINSPTIKSLWANPSFPYGSYNQTFGLNVFVAEFEPVNFSSKFKVNEERSLSILTQQSVNQSNAHGIPEDELFCEAKPQFISIFDMNYEAEVFPYSNINKFVVEPSTMFYEFNEEVQDNMAMINNPSVIYFNVESLGSKWDPEDISSDIARHLCDLGGQFYKTQDDMKTWVAKIYHPRSTDFNQMNFLLNKLNAIFLDVQQGCCLVQGGLSLAATNSVSQLDKLEQEAMEQYTASDTILPTSQQVVNQVNEIESKLEAIHSNMLLKRRTKKKIISLKRKSLKKEKL
ncbi:uncharacterized protein LOC128995959 isoform X2 [Macrosteles quadrilineatus]|uniref:uncharacterized protein LOC128995959 isoform X2 n=1 Tax=Macrosteles quadrilineatus TaxID=74068 RepID=UPI0023E15DD9|nr:uncharacterized protein LOC128995959 isoform X2 [Macrosteles quadrilineatus]